MIEDTLDRTLIYINSSNATFMSNDLCMFYVNMIEILKDVLYIKILRSEVIINPSKTLNGNVINDTDPIFVNMNDYKRILTTIKKTVGNDDNFNNCKFFDQINLNISERFCGRAIPDANISFRNESSTSFNISDPYMLIMNPNENLLNKLQISLYDKNNELIKRSDIIKFNMTVCIYHRRKKTSQA